MEEKDLLTNVYAHRWAPDPIWKTAKDNDQLTLMVAYSNEHQASHIDIYPPEIRQKRQRLQTRFRDGGAREVALD